MIGFFRIGNVKTKRDMKSHEVPHFHMWLTFSNVIYNFHM
uniref:Uncharacterized protein n=1 Tax=Anguilla anguilla TaxID=7936 RepID=A0A0E9PSV9_ANGAN